MISIIIGFKDRELKRVQSCLEFLDKQDNKEFELILVDYGSELSLNNRVNHICSKYSFVKCINNNTRGMVWNRAHALNSGAAHANGDYLFFSDIDLIYDRNFTAYLSLICEEDNVYYNRVVLLPKDFWPESTELIEWTKYDLTSKSGRGIFLISKKVFFENKGFDEFFRIWGVEDNDLSKRLIANNINEKWMDMKNTRSYHLWHPAASNYNEGLMPERWIEEMILHSWYNLFLPSFNLKNAQGLIYTESNRPCLKHAEKGMETHKSFQIPEQGLFDTASLVYRSILDMLGDLNQGEVIKIIIQKWDSSKISKLHSLLLKIMKFILVKFKSNYTLIEKEKIEKYNYFYPSQDTLYFLWVLITRTSLIHDYYEKQFSDRIEYYISKA